jgi:hypothetical protein
MGYGNRRKRDKTLWESGLASGTRGLELSRVGSRSQHPIHLLDGWPEPGLGKSELVSLVYRTRSFSLHSSVWHDGHVQRREVTLRRVRRLTEIQFVFPGHSSISRTIILYPAVKHAPTTLTRGRSALASPGTSLSYSLQRKSVTERTIKDARLVLPVEVYCPFRLQSQHLALTSQSQGLARPCNDLWRCLGHGAPSTFINLVNPNLDSQIPHALFLSSAHTY